MNTPEPKGKFEHIVSTLITAVGNDGKHYYLVVKMKDPEGLRKASLPHNKLADLWHIPGDPKFDDEIDEAAKRLTRDKFNFHITIRERITCFLRVGDYSEETGTRTVSTWWLLVEVIEWPLDSEKDPYQRDSNGLPIPTVRHPDEMEFEAASPCWVTFDQLFDANFEKGLQGEAYERFPLEVMKRISSPERKQVLASQ